MEFDPSEWLPFSFFRRPWWRWRRAEYLVATGRRRDPRLGDEWVVHARDALRGRGGSRSKAAAVRAAGDVWAAESEGKWLLEALLLTEESLDQVAERCGLPVAVVEAYGDVFFDVRSRRAASDWLLSRAAGYTPGLGFRGPQPAGVWKYAALFGGPHVLDQVVAVTTGHPLPAGAVKGTGPTRVFAEARLRLLTRLFVASVTAVTDQEVARVVEAREKLHDLDAELIGHDKPIPARSAAEFLKALTTMKRLGRTKGHGAENAVGDERQRTYPEQDGSGNIARRRVEPSG